MKDIAPIKTESDYDEALREIETLWEAPEGSKEADRLEVIVTLIEAYEAKHHPIDPPDPIEAIKFRLEQGELSPQDLEKYIGNSGCVREVLDRKRPLTLAMIRRLHQELGIPAEVLIQ